jgi:uncharacterized membrane protein
LKHFVLWVSLYSLIMAVSQILLKLGTNQVGKFVFNDAKDVFTIIFKVVLNPFIFMSVVLMASSFFLWIYILSWFKLGLVFPLTALTFVFVAIMTFLFLGEKLSAINYVGICLIASGVFFLLYK